MRNSLFPPGRKIPFILIFMMLFTMGVTLIRTKQAVAEGAKSGDGTLSPYFFVQSDDPTVDRLPLKSTSATVNISGIIADVVVTQVYKNEGKRPINAIYVFPASTRASVYGMKMTIGKRTITAKIEKREQARHAYEQARKEGKRASLLEENRPNVFQMNVANIMPGDEIKTELRYTETLVPTDGVYEFVYPTVVGPRYSNQPASGAPESEKWSQNPYLHQGEPAPYSFDIKVNLSTGVPIRDLTCPSHKTIIAFHGKNEASVKLDPVEHAGGNRDFILRYRLAGDRIESGLMLYRGKSENYFLLTAQPPVRVTPQIIPPREYIFILDVSGSMSGFPLQISKKLVKELLTRLRPTDIFNVMTFSGASDLFSNHSVPATPGNIRNALDMVRQHMGAGGTELLPALKRALSLPRTEGFARTIVIATDGYVTVEPEVFDLIRHNLGDANIFPFGIGTSVNRYIIDGMARVGGGEPFVVARADEAPAMAEKFRKYVQSPVLTHVRLDFNGFKAYDVEPARVPDVFAERPVVVCGKWKGKPQGTITLSGLSGHNKWRKRIDVSGIKPLARNSALRYLWARSVVRQLADYNKLQATDERVKEITALGIKYNLLTAYTSFVAVDSRPGRHGAPSVTVKQPLPLPMGVSDNAVQGGTVRSLAMFRTSPAGRFYVSGAPVKANLRPLGLATGTGAGPGAGEAAGKAVASGRNGYKAQEREDGGSPRRERRPHLVIESLKVTGGLSKETVKKVIEQNLYLLRSCLGGPHVISRFALKFTVAKHGEVGNVHVESLSGFDQSVSGCISEQVKKWSFSAPEGGRDVHIVMIVGLQG